MRAHSYGELFATIIFFAVLNFKRLENNAGNSLMHRKSLQSLEPKIVIKDLELKATRQEHITYQV